MRKSVYLLAVLFAIATACSKEVAETPYYGEDVNPNAPVFKAGIETKATLNVVNSTTAKVNWANGDGLTIWNGTQTAAYSTTDSGSSATFTTGDEFSAAANYVAIYPADGSAAFSAGSVTTTLPAAQTAVAGTFDPAASIAVATSTSTSLSFNNLVTYIQFTIPVGMNDLTSVSFKGNAGEKVAGAVTIDTATPALTATGSATATLSGSFTEGETYYLAVAPGNYASGYTLTIVRDSDTYEMKSTKDVTFVRSNSRNIGELFTEGMGIVLGGSAVASPVTMKQTLENDNLYAIVVDLVAGQLTLTTNFSNQAIAPVSGHDFNDGTTTAVNYSAPAADKYITIATDGKYRVIFDKSAKTVTIQSPATFVANRKATYNNTVDKINPYTQDVTELWMWGGFNGFAKDEDLKAGFQRKYRLLQSAANPYLFVYYGTNIPRSSGAYNSKNVDDDNKTTGSAWLTFLVTSLENNVFAFGSTAGAKRNDHTGRVNCVLDTEYDSVGGQGDNRYAYFGVPEGANYVQVEITSVGAENRTASAKVTFKRK